MIEKAITILIGKAIREGKYLNITYKNINGDVTPFWISISDINANGELHVNMFNVTKDKPIYPPTKQNVQTKKLRKTTESTENKGNNAI